MAIEVSAVERERGSLAGRAVRSTVLLPHAAALSGPVGMLIWVGMLGAMLFRCSEHAEHRHGHAARTRQLAGGDVR